MIHIVFTMELSTFNGVSINSNTFFLTHANLNTFHFLLTQTFRIDDLVLKECDKDTFFDFPTI